jgi:3-oxocholest-4-en-26-oyl-CoA dehydrogenase beta subunit
MEFTFTETQDAVRDLAGQIFRGQASVERVKEIEASEERIDRDLWAELAKADLLGLCLPESDGGGGLGIVELALILEQQGRVVAPVPLLPTVLAGLAIAEFGTREQQADWLPRIVAGDVILSVGVQSHPSTPAGVVANVPAGHVADRVVVAAADGLFLVDPSQGQRDVNVATDRSKVATITFDKGSAARLGDASAVDWLLDRYRTGLAAIALGVCSAAVEMTATYTSNRYQFGRPLSTNQGVALRAADAYIDIRAINATLWQAAWRLDNGLDARKQSLVAKWWASEGGQRVVHATQHLHGGMGADTDYPVHRYFLWGKTIEHQLGGPGLTLARLGEELAK